MPDIIEGNTTFNFITGARGIGKTYGAILYALEHGVQFIYMRRTQQQLDMIACDEMSPFKPYESIGYHTIIKPIRKGVYGVYFMNEDGKPYGHPICFMMALTTISNLRGFSTPDVKMLIYDEFIPETHVKAIKDEGKAFLNAYETINRNREISGEEPIKVICMANSEDLTNALYVELKLVTIAEKMIRKNIMKMVLPERDLTLYILQNSRISEQKKQTALYKLAGESSTFSKMAIENRFVQTDLSNVGSEDLRYYTIVVVIGEIAIYKHKKDNKIYVTDHIRGACEVFDATDIEQKRFRKKYSWLWFCYLRNEIKFESYIFQVLFEKYFGM